ncbi:MAG TPA: hypothetical protein VEL51_16600 [Vicinamibacterales bacterium]|nr:hypothetical protein [Vicinamibacterales bacterium]
MCERRSVATGEGIAVVRPFTADDLIDLIDAALLAAAAIPAA